MWQWLGSAGRAINHISPLEESIDSWLDSTATGFSLWFPALSFTEFFKENSPVSDYVTTHDIKDVNLEL